MTGRAMTGRSRIGLLKLVKRLKTAPREGENIKREIAEMLGPGVFYVRESRFEPAEGREEAVAEAEEVVAEDGLEPVEEGGEVEEDEYLGQHVVRRVFPEERPRVKPPARLCRVRR